MLLQRPMTVIDTRVCRYLFRSADAEAAWTYEARILGARRVRLADPCICRLTFKPHLSYSSKVQQPGRTTSALGGREHPTLQAESADRCSCRQFASRGSAEPHGPDVDWPVSRRAVRAGTNADELQPPEPLALRASRYASRALPNPAVLETRRLRCAPPRARHQRRASGLGGPGPARAGPPVSSGYRSDAARTCAVRGRPRLRSSS